MLNHSLVLSISYIDALSLKFNSLTFLVNLEIGIYFMATIWYGVPNDLKVIQRLYLKFFILFMKEGIAVIVALNRVLYKEVLIILKTRILMILLCNKLMVFNYTNFIGPSCT